MCGYIGNIADDFCTRETWYGKLIKKSTLRIQPSCEDVTVLVKRVSDHQWPSIQKAMSGTLRMLVNTSA